MDYSYKLFKVLVLIHSGLFFPFFFGHLSCRNNNGALILALSKDSQLKKQGREDNFLQLYRINCSKLLYQSFFVQGTDLITQNDGLFFKSPNSLLNQNFVWVNLSASFS